MGIVWERPSRSPQGSRKGCRCIPLSDLLRQISCKSILCPQAGSQCGVRCLGSEEQSLPSRGVQSSEVMCPRIPRQSWTCSLLLCPRLQLPLSCGAGLGSERQVEVGWFASLSYVPGSRIFFQPFYRGAGLRAVTLTKAWVCCCNVHGCK